MSWVSTGSYLEHINRLVQRRSPPRTTAPLLIESIDFSNLHELRDGADWDEVAEVLIASARRLEDAGAESLIICANSMHKIFDRIVAEVNVPVLHVADCIGTRMEREGILDAALIGRRDVMTESFFRQRLVAHGVDLRAPDMDNVEVIDRIIHDELMIGKASRQAERSLKTIITQIEQAGAKAVVLACTELELVVDVDANVLPIFDSTRIHCEAAVDWMLGGN